MQGNPAVTNVPGQGDDKGGPDTGAPASWAQQPGQRTGERRDPTVPTGSGPQHLLKVKLDGGGREGMGNGGGREVQRVSKGYVVWGMADPPQGVLKTPSLEDPHSHPPHYPPPHTHTPTPPNTSRFT